MEHLKFIHIRMPRHDKTSRLNGVAGASSQGGFTIGYKMEESPEGHRAIHFAVASCMRNENFERKQGRNLVITAHERGNITTLHLEASDKPEETLLQCFMFQRGYNNKVVVKLWRWIILMSRLDFDRTQNNMSMSQLDRGELLEIASC